MIGLTITLLISLLAPLTQAGFKPGAGSRAARVERSRRVGYGAVHRERMGLADGVRAGALAGGQVGGIFYRAFSGVLTLPRRNERAPRTDDGGRLPRVTAIYREGIATGHATFASDRRNLSRRGTARDCRSSAWWRATRPAQCSAGCALPRYRIACVYAGVAEHSVYVAAAARGRGVGHALMRALIASAEAAGIWTLQSGIFPENTASLALHEQHGFRPVGRRVRVGKMTYGPLAGQWRDTLLVERPQRDCGDGLRRTSYIFDVAADVRRLGCASLQPPHVGCYIDHVISLSLSRCQARTLSVGVRPLMKLEIPAGEFAGYIF